MHKYKARSRIWIISDDNTFLGEGRIRLLEAVKKEGSISKAAKSMNMSYVKAWKLIDQMNALANEPLVLRSAGGDGGGGTSVTPKGERVIRLFTELNDKCERFVDEELNNINW